MKSLARFLRPDTWLKLAAVLLLLPLDLLVLFVLCLTEILYFPFSLIPRQRVPAFIPVTSKASIIILNWEGRHLLEEFLPSVIEAVRQDGQEHEIIVVDNGSTDGSVEFLHSRYPNIKVLALPENRRFTGGNNAGVKTAQHDIVVFLNNDMQVEPNFIRPLLDGFQDESVFAVSCQVFFQDKSRRREETGKTRVRWRAGFLEAAHDPITDADERAEYVPIFWGGGGSCAFDRGKFLALGGLDTLYDPFYLEDTDLSYQAWKRGWRSLLAVKSVVIHKHRGTNKRKFGDNYVDNTIRKNQYLFVWKNITDNGWLLTHIVWLPIIQARLFLQTTVKFEVRAFFRALAQLPEAAIKRCRSRPSYIMTDKQIFEASSRVPLSGGMNQLAFSYGGASGQFGEGWHELEYGGGTSFRWMGRQAVLTLVPQGNEKKLVLRGAVPKLNNFHRPCLTMRVYQNGGLILKQRWFRSGEIALEIPIRISSRSPQRFELKLSASFSPARSGTGSDARELGIIISEVRLME
jgi:GT2 family glycosyltransferase